MTIETDRGPFASMDELMTSPKLLRKVVFRPAREGKSAASITIEGDRVSADVARGGASEIAAIRKALASLVRGRFSGAVRWIAALIVLFLSGTFWTALFDRNRHLVSSLLWPDVCLLLLGIVLALSSKRANGAIRFEANGRPARRMVSLGRERPILVGIVAATPFAFHALLTGRSVIRASRSSRSRAVQLSRGKANPIRRLFLFGAGASHGALGISPVPPPLARTLYDELVEAGGLWKHVPAVWGPGFRRNFEDGMLQLWDLIVADPMRAGNFMRYLHDMARFFARYRALPGNTYQRLVAELDARGRFSGSVFATLNYECLLEESLQPRPVKYFEFAASSRDSAVCWKLHGSCTFVREQELIVEGVAFPIDRPFGGPLKVIRPEEVDPYCDRQTNRPSAFASPFAPSMAVFAPNKPFPFQPPQLMEMASYWADAVAVADKIVVVGVNPNPADAHIWAPLAATSAEVIAVGGSGDRLTWNKWADDYRPFRPFRYLGDGFDQNVSLIVDSM